MFHSKGTFNTLDGKIINKMTGMEIEEPAGIYDNKEKRFLYMGDVLDCHRKLSQVLLEYPKAEVKKIGSLGAERACTFMNLVGSLTKWQSCQLMRRNMSELTMLLDKKMSEGF